MKTSTRTKLYGLLAIAAFVASVALAHGDKKHVVGTLEKINADSVVVKTAAGEVKFSAPASSAAAANPKH